MNANIHDEIIYEPKHPVPKFFGRNLVAGKSTGIATDNTKCWFLNLDFYTARLRFPITTRWRFEAGLKRICDGIGI